MMLLVIILLIGLSGFAKSITDTIQHHHSQSVFKNMNNWWRKEAWRNAWRNGDKSQGERFFGSSTVLAWLTSAWHCFDMINTLSLIVCIPLSVVYFYCITITITQFILSIIFASVWFGIIFELFYKFILIKKK